jgi:hypothetical protein
MPVATRALDLGPSDDNQPGLIRFKREFGAAERELRFLASQGVKQCDQIGRRVRQRVTQLAGICRKTDGPGTVRVLYSVLYCVCICVTGTCTHSTVLTVS